MGFGLCAPRALELEGQCYGRLRNSEDFREGVEVLDA
jgi:hypothetical protein